MRAAMGWVVAAIAAAACGGSKGVVQSAGAVDEHQGPDTVCGRCIVTGGGQVLAGGQSTQLSVQAESEAGSAAGPGFGGDGVRAKGSLDLQPGNELPSTHGDVDTILTCGRTGGVLTASFSGTGGGGRFTATLSDGGEHGDGSVEVGGSLALARTTLRDGELDIHGLDACHPPCGEGLCWCYRENECEPCDVAQRTPPPAPTPPALHP